MNLIVLRIAAYVAVLTTIFGAGYWTASNKWQAKYHKAEAAHAAERESAADAARVTVEHYRQQEKKWSQDKQSAEVKHAEEIRRIRADADRLRSSNGLLKSEAALYAAGSRSAEDTLAACLNRAATLAELFGAADAAAGDMAEAADRHAADVRVLLDAWPR